LEIADKWLGDHPDNVMLMMYKAQALYRLGRKTPALASLEQAVLSADASGTGIEIVASLLGSTGQSDTLIAWADSKLAARPQWPAMQIVLSRLYTTTNQPERAMSILEEVLKSELSAEEESYVGNSLLLAYGRSNKAEKGIALGRQMLKNTPRDVKLLNNLAYLLMSANIYTDETLRLAEAATNIAKNDHNVMDTYAMVLLGVKDFAKADLVMRRAIQEAKNKGDAVTAELYFHHAQALTGLQQFSEAREVLTTELAKIGSRQASPYDLAMAGKMNMLLEDISAQELAELSSP
jgi:tetratricopeptide (TPR) repeat protein